MHGARQLTLNALWSTPLALLLLAVGAAQGAMGHAECAAVAQAHLVPHARQAVIDLLPDYPGGDMAAAAAWADQVKAEKPWSAELH